MVLTCVVAVTYSLPKIFAGKASFTYIIAGVSHPKVSCGAGTTSALKIPSDYDHINIGLFPTTRNKFSADHQEIVHVKLSDAASVGIQKHFYHADISGVPKPGRRGSAPRFPRRACRPVSPPPSSARHTCSIPPPRRPRRPVSPLHSVTRTLITPQSAPQAQQRPPASPASSPPHAPVQTSRNDPRGAVRPTRRSPNVSAHAASATPVRSWPSIHASHEPGTSGVLPASSPPTGSTALMEYMGTSTCAESLPPTLSPARARVQAGPRLHDCAKTTRRAGGGDEAVGLVPCHGSHPGGGGGGGACRGGRHRRRGRGVQRQRRG